jgi:hypothetical protein
MNFCWFFRAIHALLAATGRSVDQQSTRRAGTDPGATFSSGRLSGFQEVTSFLKVTDSGFFPYCLDLKLEFAGLPSHYGLI